MNARISKLFLALGVASALGACASVPDLHASRPTDGQLEQIHPGLTQEEVRGLAGSPVTMSTRSGESLWTYSFTDAWGYESEYDVTFDASGVVEDVYSERIDH